MNRYDWSKDRVEKAIKNSINFCEALRYLNIPQSGNNNQTLKRKVKEYNLDVSHFTGRKREVYGIINMSYVPAEHYLKPNIRVKSQLLKDKLIIEGYKENKCEICGISEWNGKPITLQLHHIDGDHNNNTIDNLQIICPNCHSQTENYCGGANRRKITLCPDCGEQILNSSQYCSKCAPKHRYREPNEMPSKEELIQDYVEYGGYRPISKKYKVSDKTISNWFKKYGLPYKVKEIRKYIKELYPDVHWTNLRGNTSYLHRQYIESFKTICEVDKDDDIIKIYHSRKEIEEDGLCMGCVAKVCKGIASHHHGRFFRYLEVG